MKYYFYSAFTREIIQKIDNKAIENQLDKMQLKVGKQVNVYDKSKITLKVAEIKEDKVVFDIVIG